MASLEKKTYGYQEREQRQRQEFLSQLSELSAKSIVYIDQSGMNSQQQYNYGWNQKGERFYSLKSGKRQERINIISALCNGNLIAPFTVDGSCNRILFEMWLENVLLPTLKPGQLVLVG